MDRSVQQKVLLHSLHSIYFQFYSQKYFAANVNIPYDCLKIKYLWLSSGSDRFATSLIPGHLGHWYRGTIIITITRMKKNHITLKQYSQYIYVTALILWDFTNLYTSTTWTVGAKCHRFQGLEDPAEPVLRIFVLPKLPEEGEHFHVSVKHLWTPNEVIWQTWREQTVADFHSLHEHKVLGVLLSFLQLFLWPLEGTSNVKVNGETLEDALARLNQDISSLPPLTNLIPGNVSGLLFFFLLRKNCGLLFVWSL